MRDRKASHEAGLTAETVTACILGLKGYRVLARRYRTPVGEIDLVVRRRNTLAFIEVKARQKIDEALAAATPVMRERIIRAAGHFIARYPALALLDMRFDLVAVAPPFYWRHLDNAWRPAT